MSRNSLATRVLYLHGRWLLDHNEVVSTAGIWQSVSWTVQVSGLFGYTQRCMFGAGGVSLVYADQMCPFWQLKINKFLPISLTYMTYYKTNSHLSNNLCIV